MVIKLAALGCNMNLKNLEEETPLLVMMREKRRTCILALLCHGADCNVQDGHGETVLHKAVKVSLWLCITYKNCIQTCTQTN